MKIHILTPTQFQVEAESLSCSGPGCPYVTEAKWANVGDPCTRCGKPLERSNYLVDLEPHSQNGTCACYHFQMVLEPKLRRLTPEEKRWQRQRCKHILEARKVAQSDPGLDAILALLPNQERQT